MARDLAGGRYGMDYRRLCWRDLVDTAFHLRVGGVDDPFKGICIYARSRICFSEHGRAPRWKLRMPWRLEKRGTFHGIAFFPFT
jgi:hypothetical protein